MPEAAVYEDNRAIAGKDKVRSPLQGLHVETKTKTTRVQRSSEPEFDEVLDHSCGPRGVETLNQAFALEELLQERFRKALAEIQTFDAANVGVLYQAPLYRPRSASVT